MALGASMTGRALLLYFSCGFLLTVAANNAAAGQIPQFQSEQIVRTTDPNDLLRVGGYSVPCSADWNNDGIRDMVIGEGGGGFPAYVRIYFNSGTSCDPNFSSFEYAQSNGQPLTHIWDDCNCGCLGLFPRVTYWDDDNLKDLIVGTADGYVIVYTNIGSDTEPSFDGGSYLQVGQTGSKIDLDVLERATPDVVDFNGDGKKDLVVGAMDGLIRLYINDGTNGSPNFAAMTLIQADGVNLIVPSLRSSPVVTDLDLDGKKDIVAGNTDGQLIFYQNVGSDQSPLFEEGIFLLSNNSIIDLPGTPRSRPFVCDWNSDGRSDMIVGSEDGYIRVYEQVTLGDINADGAVNIFDLQLMAQQWLDPPGCLGYETQCADLIGSDGVNSMDLALLASEMISD